MISIAVFNNKGGVGKTTLLCNLAAFLAIEKKKKILIIDSDPQCNATQNLFDDRQLEKFYASSKTFTIQKVIQPLAQGKGFSTELMPYASPHFGVDVLIGDPRLALTEDLLAKDWGDAIGGGTRGLRTTHVFSEVLARCSAYDYVFFDVGPSLGALNRAVLLGCDFFMTPMSIDIFSLKAIENISTALQQWKKKLQAGIEQSEEPQELEDITRLGWDIKFIGYVTQQYTAKKESSKGAGGKIKRERREVKAYEKISKKIPEIIQNELVKKINGKKQFSGSLHLGGIPNMHSLIPMSQTSRKPVFRLKASDGVVGAHFAKINEYHETIEKIATNFIKLAGKV